MTTVNHPRGFGLTTRLWRLLRHRWQDQSHVRQCLSASSLERITTAVALSEAHHTGQIRVCMEVSLPTSYIWRALAPRDRALTLFGKYRLWDTNHRNGVLIYMLLAEHAIEIVADRGLVARLQPQQLEDVSKAMSKAFRANDFEAGVLAAIAALDSILRTHFPCEPGQSNVNELDDRPVLL